jgi:hypothetical protein
VTSRYAVRGAGSERGERGTASLEMVGLFPVVGLCIILLVYAIIAVTGFKTTVEASRDGARVYAQTDSFGAGQAAARRDVPSLFAMSSSPAGGVGHGMVVRVQLPGVIGIPGITLTKTTVMP